MILYALPWNLDAPGGINSVVRELLRSANGTPSMKAQLLVADYACATPRHRNVDEYTEISVRIIDPFHEAPSLRSVIGSIVRFPVCVWRLSRLFRRIAPSAINAHYPGLWCLTLMLGARLAGRGIRVVLSFHGADVGNFQSERSWRRFVWRLVLRHVDGITVCSHALERRLRSTASLTPLLHVTVAHNGIDSEQIDRTLSHIGRSSGTGRIRYIASVGTFESKKGHDLLLRAFHELAPRHPDLHLVLVGRSTPWREILVRLVREFDLIDRVTFLSDAPHADALASIRDSALFVLPSREEPFGIVLLEAAYLDVPIVATQVGGVPEILRDQEDALLVPPEDPQSLATAIDHMLLDTALRDRLVVSAKTRVLQLFQFKNTFAAYCCAVGVPIAPVRPATRDSCALERAQE